MYRKLYSPGFHAMQPSPARVHRLLTAVGCVLGIAGTLQAALPNGMAAYYRLNASSGLTAVDETGKHNGTLTGALAWVPGVEGNALQFRGGNGSPFVNLGAWQTEGPAGLSMALWVKWAGPNSLYQGLMSQRDGTMYWWIELSTDATQLRFKSNTSPQSNLYLTTPHLTQNEWVHVAFSHDAPAKRGTIYLNGEPKLSGTWSLPTGTFSHLRAGLGVVNVADGLGTLNGAIDEAMIFQLSLSAADVKTALRGYSDPVAVAVHPADGQADVPRDVTLSWIPAATATAHDLYLGTSAEAVGAADRTNAMGVLVSQAQDANTYAPAAPLEFGKTYYWRVDEVNAPPNTAIYKGQVWSFTVEPFAYAIQGVTAKASSAQASMGADKTVDSSGMTGDQHGTEPTTMWLSGGTPPNWIQYEFDQVYKVHELWVWNSNQLIESLFGLGAKKVTIEHSADGTTWTPLRNVPEFARAPGSAAYAPNTTVDFGGVMAKYVKLTIDTTWGGMGATGLSEVRFFHVPVQARAPQPADGATGVSLETDLNWRPGREATSHQVFLGTDPNALTAVQTVTDHRCTPDTLAFGTRYYWKVDEVGAVTYPGEIWSFTTQEYAVVDDFESYTDQEGSRIYETWIDGWTNGTGSVVGYLQAPFAEQTILHGGRQSMPLEYNNIKTPFYSETERTFDTSQDWTAHGTNTLSLYFRGNPPAFLQRADGTFVLGGGGTDIWGTTDQFRFAYQQLSGNGSIVARVDSLVRADAWTKVGVMIRETLEAGSRHAAVVVTPDNGVSFLQRITASAASQQVNQTGLKAPYWVKLTRTGNTFAAQRSADGVTWANITNDPATSSVDVTMAANVYIGLAVTSHNAAAQTTAQFSNVATTGAVTGQWQSLAIGVAQPSNDPAPLYLVVEDKAGHKAMVVHANPEASTAATWQQWQVPLREVGSAGVNLAAVKKLTIGVGDRASPKPGAAGKLYIDDIGVGHPGL